MSSSTATLRPGAGVPVRPRARELEGGRPLVRMLAFTGLVALGALRWATLVAPAASGRMLELAAVALALSVLGPPLSARSRALAGLAALVAALGMLAISGLPVAWIRDVRLAVSAHAIGQGLDALPRLLVPYKGINEWVRMVIDMGAAVLLFDAALMMAFAMDAPAAGPRAATGDLRRAVAALPLVALVAVPLTLVPAELPYAQGLILFVLLAAFIWGERLPSAAAGGAVLACGVAAMAAMVIAPAINARQPWINYRTLAGGAGGGGGGEQFSWTQSYGQLTWPQEGRNVLEVRAPRADYWKVESLDTFAAGGWQTLAAAGFFGGGPSGLTGVSAANLKRWTQTDTFTIDAMTTSLVVGEGTFGQPVDATEAIGPGPVPGTYISANPMGTGDSYRIRAYSPRATPAELAAAGTQYSGAIIPQELAVGLPASGGYRQETVWVDPFGSPPPHLIESYEGNVGAALLAASPYAPVYALAQRLRAGTHTPYQYAERVMAYLGHGFQYTLAPGTSAQPIVDFLLHTHAGYCQQFAGAMALLLRLGGVPARVAVGFTSGQLDAATHEFVVSDFDAHAWVEVYFPTIGWVRFDPTPPVDIALQHSVSAALLPNGSSQQAPEPNSLTKHGLKPVGEGSTQAPATHGRHHGGGTNALLPGLAVAAALALVLGLLMIAAPAPTGDQQLRELERAFARSGRPLAPHVTLAELERRMAGLPGAEGYLRALSAARFGAGGAGATPGRAERRALRAHLGAGLGAAGRLRALWAVPPPALARLSRLPSPRRRRA
jgi:transglutaminase-like putative cysteine protease